MNRIITLGCLTILLLVPDRGEACSCMWAGPFLTVAPGTEAIVRAKVVGYHAESRGIQLSMDVDVLEVMKGIVSSKRIRIWGDNGSQCRPYVSAFPVGTEWVLAVNRLKEGPSRGDFFVSVCGEYWAKVEGNAVLGRLTGSSPPTVSDVPEHMSLDELRTRLSTKAAR